MEQDAAAEHWLLPSKEAKRIDPPPHSITFVSHSTVDHLPTLVPLMTAWDGPVSVAVFLASDKWEVAQHAARVIGTLKHCSPLIKSTVSFHLVIPQDETRGSDGRSSKSPGWCWDQHQPLLLHAELSAEAEYRVLNGSLQLPRPWTVASASAPNAGAVWNCEPRVYADLEQLANQPPQSAANLDSNTAPRATAAGLNGPPHPTRKEKTDDRRSARANPNYARAHAYPNNLLRNVARKHASTPFSLVADIDLIPRPRTLQQDFQQLVAAGALNPDANGGLVAFVVPAFEVKAPRLPNPPSRLPEQYTSAMVTEPAGPASVLQAKQAFNKTLQPFYYDLCWKCQRHTQYNKWLGGTVESRRRSKQLGERYGDDGAFFMDDHDPVFGSLEEIYHARWHEPWEPFYIAETETAPLFDERFRQYGFNRISQVCHMHMAGFDFVVLRGSFLVHQTQKRVGEFHGSKAEEQDRNRLIFRKLKEELKREFPSERRCNEAGYHV